MFHVLRLFQLGQSKEVQIFVSNLPHLNNFLTTEHKNLGGTLDQHFNTMQLH